ncbi:MAG: DNA-protecting protein DprA, partial [Alphaproteobacteria bacterium]|nr:DNA-protecting protein DprA [Alphaproteobacteria bacterium]
MEQELSENDKAIILLCAHLGNDSYQPLSNGEYSKVVEWLRTYNKQPCDLLNCDDYKDLSLFSDISEERIRFLLGRGFQLGAVVDDLAQKGISIVTRNNINYPIRFKRHLQKSAPPILYYVGDISLANHGGIAIVGSRNIDEQAKYFTEMIAKQCANEKMYVISGGAKGVDMISTTTTLNHGGRSVCIVSDELFKKSLQSDIRRAIVSNQLVLISPYFPTSPFNVGNAMGRNKLIYALADYAIVVSSDYNKGGTWSGAVEEMRRSNKIPVFVRNNESAPLGNKKLVEKGALPITVTENLSLKEILDTSLRESVIQADNIQTNE